MKTKIIIGIASLIFVLFSCKESTEELIDQGVSLADKGRYKEAIEKYTKVIDKNSKIQLAYLSRGLCYINTKEYLKSLADFNAILNLKTLGGGNIIFTLNPDNADIIEEAKYQVPYDDGIYGRAQARYFLDSLKSSYEDFERLINNNYEEKVFCILFQSDILHESGSDTTACQLAQWARKIAKKPSEIADCESTVKKYCEKINID